MRLVNVKVSRSEHESTIIQVPSWEIPVLQTVHDPEKIEVQGEVDVPDRDYPDAGAEFDRLQRRYREDIKTEQYFVNMVYGQGSVGVNALRQAIELDRSERAKPTKKAKAAPVAPVASEEIDV